MKILMNGKEPAFSILLGLNKTQANGQNHSSPSDFISSFRHILQKPDLSRAQLASMLRNAERYKKNSGEKVNWASLMKGVMASGANSNENQVI
jgi:hypothetical protein